MTGQYPGVVRVAAVLAEALVTGQLGDDGCIAYRVYQDCLDLQLATREDAHRVAHAVIPGVAAYTSHRSAEKIHHTWTGERDGVPVRVVGLSPLDEDPDPLLADGEDDYLRRLMALGLVVDDRASLTELQDGLVVDEPT